MKKEMTLLVIPLTLDLKVSKTGYFRTCES